MSYFGVLPKKIAGPAMAALILAGATMPKLAHADPHADPMGEDAPRAPVITSTVTPTQPDGSQEGLFDRMLHAINPFSSNTKAQNDNAASAQVKPTQPTASTESPEQARIRGFREDMAAQAEELKMMENRALELDRQIKNLQTQITTQGSNDTAKIITLQNDLTTAQDQYTALKAKLAAVEAADKKAAAQEVADQKKIDDKTITNLTNSNATLTDWVWGLGGTLVAVVVGAVTAGAFIYRKFRKNAERSTPAERKEPQVEPNPPTIDATVEPSSTEAEAVRTPTPVSAPRRIKQTLTDAKTWAWNWAGNARAALGNKLVTIPYVGRLFDTSNGDALIPPVAELSKAENDTLESLVAAASKGRPNTGDALYEKAVDVVLKEGKAPTNFIQRMVGVNRDNATQLLERMEQEGLVSAPDHVGKRTVYQPNIDPKISWETKVTEKGNQAEHARLTNGNAQAPHSFFEVSPGAITLAPDATKMDIYLAAHYIDILDKQGAKPALSATPEQQKLVDEAIARINASSSQSKAESKREVPPVVEKSDSTPPITGEVIPPAASEESKPKTTEPPTIEGIAEPVPAEMQENSVQLALPAATQEPESEPEVTPEAEAKVEQPIPAAAAPANEPTQPVPKPRTVKNLVLLDAEGKILHDLGQAIKATANHGKLETITVIDAEGKMRKYDCASMQAAEVKHGVTYKFIDSKSPETDASPKAETVAAPAATDPGSFIFKTLSSLGAITPTVTDVKFTLKDGEPTAKAATPKEPCADRPRHTCVKQDGTLRYH